MLISTLLILFAGCSIVPDDQPGYTPGTITGIIAAPCCSTSAGAVSEPQGVSPEFWCYDCENTWSLKDNIKVVLTYGEDEVATTTTNELGEYTFTDVVPGKNYVITAYCTDSDYDDDKPLVKDVALEVVAGGSFDAKITDCVSTALGLVVDYLVEFTVLTPEDIVLDGVIAGIPNFYSFPEFKKLVLRICEISTGCVNLFDDAKVMDYLCRAAEEVGQIVLPDLDLGCGPGYAPTTNFAADETVTYTLTTAILPVSSGTVTGAGTYDAGTVVNITATPVSGYYFVNWTGAVTGSVNPTTVTMDADKTVTANFAEIPPDQYTLTVNIVGSGSVTKSPDQATYLSGTVVGLDPQAAAGWAFAGWSGDLSGSDDPKDITMNSNKTVTATFTLACINHAPVIGNLPPTNVQMVNIWQTYTYDVNATDPDGNTLKYTLTTKPNGMTINESTGVITWTLANCEGLLVRPKSGGISKVNRCHKLCDINVTVKVTDNGCGGPLFDEESFIVEVWQP